MKFHPQLTGDSLLGATDGATAQNVSDRTPGQVERFLEFRERSELHPKPMPYLLAMQYV